jgi:hypothetical protein
MASRIQIDDRELRSLLSKAKNATQILARALYEEGNEIFNESQRLVPVVTGALAGSGRVTSPSVNATAVEVTIGYGGAAAPYAIYVHEMTELNHKYAGAKNASAQAKFLEEPALKAAETLDAKLASRIERLLKP